MTTNIQNKIHLILPSRSADQSGLMDDKDKSFNESRLGNKCMIVINILIENCLQLIFKRVK